MVSRSGEVLKRKNNTYAAFQRPAAWQNIRSNRYRATGLLRLGRVVATNKYQLL